MTPAYVVLKSIMGAAAYHHIPVALLMGICTVESGLNPNAINKSDGDGTPSIGLCQVKRNTAALFGYKGNDEGLLAPNRNAFYAARYLRYQYNRYKGDIKQVISAYNIGHSGLLPNKSYKNKKYVDKVYNLMLHYSSSQ